MKHYCLGISLATLACAGLPQSAIANTLTEALSQSTHSLSLRLRHESSEQDNSLKDASSNTLRHRLGLSTGNWHGLSAKIETEGTIALGHERYNSGPGGNAHTQYSVVADPTDTELNQAWLNYSFGSDSSLRLGRQRIILDNARFVGNVGWRQNEQTYDAALLKSQLTENARLQYAYLSKVNNIFFGSMELDGHLLNLNAQFGAGFNATAYTYLLDYANAEDTQTMGLRLHGKLPLNTLKFGYSLEYAEQSDYADSTDIDADYFALELKLQHAGVGLSVGQENLSGDGARGFSTPLATLHKFNGFADIFLSTPVDGLSDTYAKLSYKKAKWSIAAIYHQFEAERLSADYGSEIDAVMTYAHSKKQKWLFKLADYTSDGRAVDTRKLSLNYMLQL